MSAAAERRKACTGKVRFRTMREALTLAERLSIAEGRPTVDTDAYQCRFCGGYHAGHTPARVRAAAAGKA